MRRLVGLLLLLLAGPLRAEHWAYVPPRLPAVPAVRGAEWCRGELDRFVLAEQERHGLAPSPMADSATLARRLALDLTGLPAEGGAESYNSTVERLLASPRFGERWASVWLDLARFADTQGYEKDNLRTIWAYRDWVIKAFNDDLPFDRFTIEQLAGDLLPEPTADQLTATAFHRNTMTNTEGGTDDEEFRVKAVLDRVNTTWTAWMGTTFACAQCHDHPTEPITRRDYYRFFAYFNNTADTDQDDDRPVLQVLPIAQRERAAELRRRLAAARGKAARLEAERGPAPRGEWRPLVEAKNVTALQVEVPAAESGRAILSHFDAVVRLPDGSERAVEFAEPVADAELPGFPVRDAIGRESRNRHGWGVALGAVPHWAVFPLREAVAEGGTIRVHLDDAFEPRECAFPACTVSASDAPEWTAWAHPPAALLEARATLATLAGEIEQLPETTVPILREVEGGRETHLFRRGNWLEPEEAVSAGGPAAFPPLAGGNRLALARWLVAPENPLPARVMVNRIWARLFGRGLVETEEDFGATGAAPSHPALLDWLAVHFQTDWHWSVKRLLREIVLSSTYRQSSAASQALLAADPENRWLARGARFPLPAEMVRDQALAVAGLLSPRLYGPSVMPPQPEGVWQVVYSAQRWVTSPGENRFRRSLYTFWRRTSPYPGLALLDAPSRESCTPRRARSATPASALVTLNDPVYVEAAAAFARRMETEGGGSADERLRYGWRLLLGTQPSERTLARLVPLWTQRPEAAAQALLNLDAALMRE